jgi:hypothetical protein
MPSNSACLTPIPDAAAALVFAGGQLIFQYRERGVERAKIVSTGAARAAFEQVSLDTGWLPPGTMRWGVGPKGAWAVQLLPPQEMTLQFSRAADEDALPDALTLQTPPLALLGIGTVYHLWAVREAEAGPDAALCYAPFPNIYQEAHICFGANKVAPVEQDGMRQALKLFSEAPFGAASVVGKSQRHPEDVRLMLLEVARSDQPYPLDDLVPYRQQHYTLGERLDYLLARQ